MRNKLVLLSLTSRRRFLRLSLVFKIINNINCPDQLKDYLVRRSDVHKRSFRDTGLLDLPKVSTKMGQNSFKFSAAKDWNDLPVELRELTSLSLFKNKLFK